MHVADPINLYRQTGDIRYNVSLLQDMYFVWFGYVGSVSNWNLKEKTHQFYD